MCICASSLSSSKKLTGSVRKKQNSECRTSTFRNASERGHRVAFFVAVPYLCACLHCGRECALATSVPAAGGTCTDKIASVTGNVDHLLS